jgi:hypothetical protein
LRVHDRPRSAALTAGFSYSGSRAAVEERIEETLRLVGLDDIQRVSDTVAILDRGELVALAPIEQLLA